jgi:hypothetical protein
MNRSGLPVRGFNSILAVESLVALVHSQGNLTVPRRKNQEIRHKIKIFKSKWTRFLNVGTSYLSNDTKKTYHKISWDYLFNGLRLGYSERNKDLTFTYGIL